MGWQTSKNYWHKMIKCNAQCGRFTESVARHTSPSNNKQNPFRTCSQDRRQPVRGPGSAIVTQFTQASPGNGGRGAESE